jgi:sugar phosphate isomerase/epimerase
VKLAFPVATPETNDGAMLALRGDLSANFDLLAELGYEGAELMVRDPRLLDPSALTRAARASALAIVGVSTGQIRKEDGLSLSALAEETRRQAVERGRAAIELAAAVGAPQVNVGTFRGTLPPAPGDAEAARRAGTESLMTLADVAHRHGIVLALEVQCRFVVNWLNTVDETLAWFDEFPFARPRLLFDVYHAMIEEASIAASLVRARPHLSYVQVADSNRLVPGRGHLPIADILRVLAALGYDGYIGIEVRPEPTAAVAAAAGIRALRLIDPSGS